MALPSKSPAEDSEQNFSCTTLEFDSVVRKLADLATFPPAAALALELPIHTTVEAVARGQAETSEAVHLINTGINIAPCNIDPESLIKRLALGGVMTGEELVNLATLLEISWNTARRLTRAKTDLPLLSKLANEIPDTREVATIIRKSVTDSGDLKDSASALLGELRSRSAQAYLALTRILNKLTQNLTTRHYLQSTNIASRANRLVLEVKREFRNKIPGIVYGISNAEATVFMEPSIAIEPCNKWRELEAEVRREEHRIMVAISELAGAHLDEIMLSISTLTKIHLIMAKGRLASAMNASSVSSLKARGAKARVTLKQAWHPLLKEPPVASDIELGGRYKGLVISGPNAGGKTVTLKTIGLLCLMHQAGLHISASPGSELSVFKRICADIGDNQSIEYSISTFAAHLKRVAEFTNNASKDTLVLLDELGSGTAPDEGAALACAVLEHLTNNGCLAAITTHYKRVASFAAKSNLLENASMGIDPDTLKASYRLMLGMPGSSYAFQLAHSSGLPDAVIDAAYQHLSGDDKNAEAMVNTLLAKQQEVARARANVAKLESELADKLKGVNDFMANVEQERRRLVLETQRDLQREATKVRTSLKKVVKTAQRDTSLEAARKALDRIQGKVVEPTWYPMVPAEASLPEDTDQQKLETVDADIHSLKPGDKVVVVDVNKIAEVFSCSPTGELELLLGNLKIKTDIGKVRVIAPRNPAKSNDSPRN